MLPTRASTLDRAAELIADYGVAAIVLSLPLEFTARFLHQQLSRFVAVVVVIAFAYLLARRRRSLEIPRAPSVWLLLALVAVSIASWSLTRAPGSKNTLLDIALYPLVALLVANLVRTREDHRRAWIAFLASALGVAVLGVALYLTHTQIWAPNPAVANRLNITFADPNITARFLTLGACAAVLVFAARQTRSWLAIGAATLCGIALPMTYSRSGLALFIVMVALMVVLAFDHKRAAAIAALALIAFAVSTEVNPDTRQRAAYAAETWATVVTGHHASSTSTSTADTGSGLEDNRVYLIAAGVKMFADHPLFGVGYGGYQHALLTTYKRFLPHGYTDSVSHTAVITVVAEQGVIGGVLLVVFFLELAREAWVARRRRDEWSLWSTVPAAMVVPIFLYSEFEARLFQEPYLWFVLGMFYGAQMIAARRRSAVTEEQSVRVRRQVEAA